MPMGERSRDWRASSWRSSQSGRHRCEGSIQVQGDHLPLVDEEKKTSTLLSAKAGPNSASASAQMDDQKVSLHAEFDPRPANSRPVTASKRSLVAKKKKVAVRKDAKRVDLLPTQFLEMLQLPEGSLRPGSDQSSHCELHDDHRSRED